MTPTELGKQGELTFTLSPGDSGAFVCVLSPPPAQPGDPRCSSVPREVQSRMSAMGERLVSAAYVGHEHWSYTVTLERDANTEGGDLTLTKVQKLASQDFAGARWATPDAEAALVSLDGPSELGGGVFHASIASSIGSYELYYANAADGSFAITFAAEDAHADPSMKKDAAAAMRTIRLAKTTAATAAPVARSGTQSTDPTPYIIAGVLVAAAALIAVRLRKPAEPKPVKSVSRGRRGKRRKSRG